MIEVEQSTPKTRLLEVATWGWRVACVGTAIFFMFGALMVYAEASRISDLLGILALYISLAIVVSASVWVVRYVATGNKADFFTTLHKTSFGNMPFYWWFLLGTLYFGGLGTVLARNASDDAIIISDFSEGVGGALGVVALGYLGWFLAPQKFRREGHMVGIIIAGILAIIALPYLSGTLLTKP